MGNVIWGAVGVWLGANLAVLALVAFSAHRRLSGERRGGRDGANGH